MPGRSRRRPLLLALPRRGGAMGSLTRQGAAPSDIFVRPERLIRPQYSANILCFPCVMVLGGLLVWLPPLPRNSVSEYELVCGCVDAVTEL